MRVDQSRVERGAGAVGRGEAILHLRVGRLIGGPGDGGGGQADGRDRDRGDDRGSGVRRGGAGHGTGRGAGVGAKGGGVGEAAGGGGAEPGDDSLAGARAQAERTARDDTEGGRTGRGAGQGTASRIGDGEGAIGRTADEDRSEINSGLGTHRQTGSTAGPGHGVGGGGEDGVDISAEVPAIGAGILEGAGGGEVVVAAGVVDEAGAGVIAGGEEGAGGIGVVGAADHGVLGEEVAGIEGVEGGQGVAVEAAAAEGDVVGEDKILERGAAAAEDVHAVEGVGMGDQDGIVIDGDIAEAGAGGGGGVMEHALHAPGDIGEGADVEKEVVLEEDALEGLGGAVVVGAHVGIPGRGAVDDVVGDGDVRDDMPGAAAAGAGGEGDTGAGVGLEVVVPGVFQDVAVEEDAGGVFEFEEILDRPGGQAGVGVVGIVPGGRFEEMVAADLDVGRDDAVRGILGEHDVLAGGLDLIIDDLKGAGAAVAQDAVGLVTEFVDVGDPGIEDGGGGAVDDDAVAEAAGGGAVDVAAVEDEVSGGGAAIEIDDGVGRAAGGGPGGGELDAGEAVVMGTSRRGNGGYRVGSDDLGHEGSLGGGDAGAGGGKAAQGGGEDIDPARPRLSGEGEVAGVGGAGGEDDDAIGLGGVEGTLKVAAGRDGDGRAGGEGVGGIQVDAGQLRHDGRVSGRRCRN